MRAITYGGEAVRIAAIQDISERIEFEQALRASEERLDPPTSDEAGEPGVADASRRLSEVDRAEIIVGEQDAGTPVAMSQAIHSAIAGSELVVIPQASHLSNLEQPEQFNAALSRFLGEN